MPTAVSWGAVLAGAAVAAAVSLLLFALATGLDLAALSSTSTNRATPASFTVIAAVALIVTHWIPASLGGYITGRLRTRWIGTPTHEVFFRDGAHGFLTWSVATVFMASGLGSGLASTASRLTGAVHSGGAAVHTAQPSPFNAQSGAFGQAPLTASAPTHSELVVPDGPTLADMLDTDRTYLARPAATPGAVPEPGDVPRPAWDRPAWQASEAERRDAAANSIFTALSMLVGALIASISAALGGRIRDLHP
jgi:hypothetical protein